MQNPFYYKTYAIRCVPRSKFPYLIFDMFNPYQPVAKAISTSKALGWIEKQIARRVKAAA